MTSQLPEISRSRVQALLKAGNVTVDGKSVRAHSKVTAGMEVELLVPPPAELEIKAEEIPLDVLHEDSALIVVNKPAGLVVHPAPGHDSGTLVNALLYYCSDLAGLGGELRPGIVHRLDKDTSGVLVVAKTDPAMLSLSGQFHDRLVKKEYVALVHGVPSPRKGTIETQIGRSWHNRKRMAVRTRNGREAITSYEVEETYEIASLLRVRIATGRTHQIRVHMTHIGCPVAGDNFYGRSSKDKCLPVIPERQLLHAEFLSFTHPVTRKEVSFTAPWPADLTQAVEALRSDENRAL